MLKSNNFSYYLICKLSLVNIKIPSFSFLKKAILGLHKNLFWHISRKIGKILKKFQKAPLKALLNQEKIFSKRLLKMHSFPKKKIYLKKMSVHPLGRILSYSSGTSRPEVGAENVPFFILGKKMYLVDHFFTFFEKKK